MTLRKRRFVYLSFIAAFVIIAPIIGLYGGGYRYNFRLKQWQRTGGIVVAAYPESAEVTLDNELQPQDSLTRLTDLLPREYDVTVSSPGYHIWKRSVDVRGSETVFLTNVELFRQDPSLTFLGTRPADAISYMSTSTTTILDSGLLALEKSTSTVDLIRSSQTEASSTLMHLPLSEYVFAQALDSGLLTTNIWQPIYDLRHETLYLLLYDTAGNSISRRILLSPATGWVWSEDGEQLAYHNSFEIWVIDLNNGSQELVTRRSGGIQGVAWHPRGSYLYYANGDKLRVIERKPSSSRQELELASVAGLNSIATGELEDNIYIEAHLGNQQGWFSLEVQ